MLSKVATTPRGNNSTGVEPNIDQGHNLTMAKKPTLDEMRLALSKVMPRRQRDANLKKFLSPSKVKEKLYHATPANFKEFQGEGFDPTISGNATWLSTDPHHQPAMHNISGGRDAQFRQGTNVMPVHVQAKVPLYLDDKDMIEYARAAYANGSSEFPDLLSPNTVKLLKEDGYDSIIHADPYKTGRAHEIIMLEPKRIKSAIGNRGTYDPTDPDITKAKGGEVMPQHQREANKAKFLEKSKVKDVLYRGQRRSPKADKFITTQDRATPSFTTDPEVANVYSRQLGWDIEHGPGSTSVPVHVQMEKPFDIRNLGEHASLDEFIDRLDHDLTVPTHPKKLGYEDLADILHTLDNSVFKGGAKHTINARTSKGYRVKGFDQLGDEIISAGKKKDIDRILLDLLPEASVDAYALADNPYFVKHLKKLGYDSIIHKDVFDAGMPYYQGNKDKIEEGYDANHVIDAYRPLHQNKIKSAIGNRGTYDVNESDITKAKGGEVHMAEGGKPNDAAFIGYLSPHGKFESYPESVAKANDYHHSHTVKDLDAYDAEGGLTFVRMGGEPIVSIKGTPAMDPFHHKHSPMVSDLARRIIASGGHPDMPIKVEDMGFKPHEAPYQNKHIGTLHEWSMRNVPKKAKGGSVEPKNTVKAYKLFRVHEKHPGKLFPLFVDANTPVEMGKWVHAKIGEQLGEKVKSKIGPLAMRPGWHAGDLPVATHIGEKSHPKLIAPDTRPHNHAWAEVEMPNDVDWQTEANKRGMNKKGELISKHAHITDQVPKGGHYRYKTNPNMTGNWLIGGAMKVNRILSDAEVKKINDRHGVADLPRAEPFKKKTFGFAHGGVVAPEAWIAEEHVHYGAPVHIKKRLDEMKAELQAKVAQEKAYHQAIKHMPFDQIPTLKAWAEGQPVTHAHHLEIEERPL